MDLIDSDRFADQVYVATKNAFTELIRGNSDQTFYAFALWTDDSLQYLQPAANTEEALTATVQRYRETVDSRYGTTSARDGMRWSYGDWGFFPYEDGDHFREINEALNEFIDSEDEVFEAGIDSLWAAILNGFKRLETEQFFGSGSERSKVTLLLVGDLPSELVDSWVAALNPPDVVARYSGRSHG